MALPYGLGSRGEEITYWQQWFGRAYKSYAPPADGYYGSDEARAVVEMQRRLGLPQTGIFDEQTAAKAGYPGFKPRVHRPIWVYSAAGTGGQWFQGPPFETGEWCKRVLNLNHQPIGYPAGGFLGFMGGDPKLSYLDSIANLDSELERLLDSNPDLANPAVEFWFTGYSQSADGIKKSVTRLFGDGGKYAHLRSRINGMLMFGDPTRAPGPTKVGNNPPGYGIARWDAPQWVDDLCWSITNNGDLYACTTDDTLVKLFYPIFIRAETELPFAIYIGKIIIPALLNLVPIFGGFLGPAAGPLLAGMTGMGMPILNQLLSGIGGSTGDPDPELIKLLSIQGLLTNLPALVKTLISLQGIAVHGDYFAPKPEFGGRNGCQVACDVVAGFRR